MTTKDRTLEVFDDRYWPTCPRCKGLAIDYQEHVFWGWGCPVEDLPDAENEFLTTTT